jgi:hypothetical protein
VKILTLVIFNQNPEKYIWSKSLGLVKQAWGFTLYTFTPNDPKILEREREREPRISRKELFPWEHGNI